MEYLQGIPWAPILFIMGLIGSLFKLYYDVEAMKKAQEQTDKNLKAMSKQFAEEKELMMRKFAEEKDIMLKQFEAMNKEMAETNKELAIIRSHLELGTLEKLKTYGRSR